MRNNVSAKRKLMKHFWLGTLSACALSIPAFAQTIEQGTLDAPVAYDAGILDVQSGGLDPSLWQGTSARLAHELIENAPLNSDNPLVQEILRTVLLSSGIPPKGSEEDLRAYEASKLEAVSRVSDSKSLKTLISRSGAAGRAPAVRAELALRGGDISAACNLSDTITENRADVFWSRLRTLCHLRREEFAAAELTTELLRSGGYQNDAYYGLVRVMSGTAKKLPKASEVNDPITQALYDEAAVKLDAARPGQAMDPQADPDLRLAALYTFSNKLSDKQITQVFSDLAFDLENPILGPSFDYASASANTSAQGTAQLFLLAKAKGNPDAAAKSFAALLKRAPNVKMRQRLMSLLAESIETWPAEVQANSDLGLFARAAVQRGDVPLLQGLYAALPKGDEKARVALAADALGNGFLLGQMGSDIDERLSRSDNERAKRDALLALALGAQLSDTAAQVLPGAKFSATETDLTPGDRAVLSANARARATAQLLLRIAPNLDKSDMNAADLAFVIDVLQQAGLTQYAGRLAAMDFLAPL